MSKKLLGMDVLIASRMRISWTFDTFERVYLSFSAGKDSTVMLHLAAEEARKRGVRFGVLLVDLEGQYNLTINHALECVQLYSDVIDLYWVALPLALRNAVSVYEPYWECWQPEREADWIRQAPPCAITNPETFDFWWRGMEFEEFVPLFGEWYAGGKSTACMVGIRASESLNRYRTIASTTKTKCQDKQYTTKVTDNVFNVYPIYDWYVKDIWTYHAKFPGNKPNPLYEYMHKAGVPLGSMRICEPYGDDQRRGLWLFHLIEPATWSKVVARVAGANSGALYVKEDGNINGYNKITKPENHTWESFAKVFLGSLPKKSSEHFDNKIYLYCKWWEKRGYPEGIPDFADHDLETKTDVPSWRKVCKALLRNDYWCKTLGFSQQKSTGYQQYMDLMRRRKNAGVAKLADITK